MQTVFAEKTEDRSLDDNRHIGELFFIRMYWEKGRIPSGNILYWKDAKREDAQINFTGFDGLLLYLDETCERMVYYCGKHRSGEIRKEDGILKRERNWSW